jgi:DNA segregation ATPase FtsK/SpoIIIE-like protein
MFCRMPSTSVLLSEMRVPGTVEPPLDVDEAADRLEQALSSLSLPIRIEGGRMRQGGVRYVATPINGTRVEQLQDAEASIAHALGVPQVHVARDGEDLAIEVPGNHLDWPRLLSLLQAIGDRGSLSLVAGLDRRGMPVLVPLRQPDTWHVAILAGSGAGKSELMRSVVLSLALTNRQSMVQLFGIDLSGRELTALEAVPHRLTDVATEPRLATELMVWLMEEGARRAHHGILRPDLVLAVDDTSRLVEAAPSTKAQLRQLALQGRRWGIHLLLADRPSADPSWRPWGHTPGWAIAKGDEAPGRFTLTAGIRALRFTAAWLPASDLNLAVQQARTGKRPHQADLFYSISRKELGR